MDFFKQMDLYKAIVLLSVVLLPLGGWWINELDTQIELCDRALYDATKRGGLIEEIGALQRQIEVVEQNRRSTSDTIEQPGIYFEQQILQSASPVGSLQADDFAPKPPLQEPARVGKQKLVDHVVKIDWGRQADRKKVMLDFVYRVLFNCESGAQVPGSQRPPTPSVWRLRKLRLVNATNEKIVSGYKVPDPEMQDAWYIKDMQFARRGPRN